MNAPVIGVVLVSHSAQLVEGLRAVALQMAQDVVVAVAGGDDEGGIGTSADRITAAVDEAETGDGAVVLYDLGRARLTTEMVIEMMDPERAERVRLVDAPLVEGALAAVTAITGDTTLDGVAAAARGPVPSAEKPGSREAMPGAGREPAEEAEEAEEKVTRELELRNPQGLHARPAAAISRAVRSLEARVLVRSSDHEADAASMLSLAGLGARRGDRIIVTASGPEATQAVESIAALVEEGFGEIDGADAGGAEDADGIDAVPGGRAAAAPDEGIAAGGGELLHGRTGAPGGGLGPLRRLAAPDPQLPTAAVDDPDTERARLTAAIERARREVAAEAERTGAVAATGPGAAASTPTRDILRAHEELLDDPALRDAAVSAVDGDVTAEQAWWKAVTTQRDILRRSGTELLVARAADVVDVGLRVLACLGVDVTRSDPEPETVLVGDDITPSEVTRAYQAGVAAVVTTGGSPTSHAAIIARTLGVPMVTGAPGGLRDVADGTTLMVDADTGTVVVAPDAEAAARFRERLAAAAERRHRLRTAAHEPVTLSDGRRLRIGANIASLADARAAVANGADEVGLLRTEFLFVDRADVPDEQEQVDALRAMLDALDGRPTVVRTMDVGGDKRAPALGMDPVRNGFLGQRGIRWCLAHDKVFRPHLRAVLRAAAEYPVRVMFPFVTTLAEIEAARRQLDAAAGELEREGAAFSRPQQVGVMLEIPAAALRAADLAAAVDFFSIGSNDLVQYLTAADRTLPDVAELADAANAHLLAVIRGVVGAARAAGIWTGVCGEIAADPPWAARLAEAGVDELSMAPTAIPEVKAHLRGETG